MTKYGSPIIHNIDDPLIKEYNHAIQCSPTHSNMPLKVMTALQRAHKEFCVSLLDTINKNYKD